MPIKDKKLPNGKWLYKIRPYIHFEDGVVKQTTIRDKNWTGRDGFLEAQKLKNQLTSEIFPVGATYDKEKKTFISQEEINKREQERKKAEITLNELKEEYLSTYEGKRDVDTIKAIRACLNHFCEYDNTEQITTYPDKVVSQIDQKFYHEWQIQMKKKLYTNSNIKEEYLLEWKKDENDRKYKWYNFSIKRLNVIHNEICRMICYAVEEGYCSSNFAKKVGCIGTPKEIKLSKKRREYVVINYSEFVSLLEVSKNNLKYNTYFDLESNCGLRAGEIRALRIKDYNKKKKQLMINHTLSKTNELKDPKTVSSKAPIDLDDELCQKIDKIIERKQSKDGFNENWYIFGEITPISTNALNYNKNKYFKLAGIDKPGFRLHDFRHSCATWLFSIGVPIAVISTILRHKDIKETLETYTHLFEEDYTSALELIKKYKQDQKQDQTWSSGERKLVF